MAFLRKILARKRYVALALFAILLFLFFANRGAGNLSQIKTANAEKKDIKSEVIASGKVAARSESSPHFAVAGKVVWVGVEKGDHVERGQAIASLDKEEFEIALRQASQDLWAAEAELVRTYDDLTRSTGAESYPDRVKRTNAEAKKNKAVDDELAAKRNLKDTVLTSPIAGTVIDLPVKAGQEILVTTDIAKIADLENLVFKAEVDETDIAKVSVGQATKLTLDAFEDKDIATSTSSIGQTAITTSTGATAFEVEFSLDSLVNYLSGMNGEVSVVTEEKNQVLAVPQEAIFDDKFVWVKTDKGYEKKEVSLGISSDSDVEITSGLEQNQEVVTSGVDQIEKRSLLQKILRKK